MYAEKVTGKNQKDKVWLRYGREMEGPIATIYSDETNREVIDQGPTHIVKHPKYDWLSCTPDRIVTDSSIGEGCLEIKTINNFETRAEDWAQEPSLHHQIQLQTQMACTGLQWGSLAAMFPYYQFRCVDLDRDDELIDSIIPELEKFWERVINEDPPPPDNLPGTLDVVKRLYPNSTGKTVSLTSETELVLEWEQLKKETRELSKRAKEIEITLRAKMQDAELGELSDGTFLTLKTTKRKAYTKVVEASEYRTLRRYVPKG